MKKLTKINLEKYNEQLKASKNAKRFASRKTHTKTYAIENKLFLKANQTSSFENKPFDIKIDGKYKTVRIDWEAAVSGKYGVSIDEWKSLDFKSRKVSQRDIKNMSDAEWNEYNRFFSRKSKFNKVLQSVEVELADFLEAIESTEEVFFSDMYLDNYKQTNIANGRKSTASPYDLSNWLHVFDN